MSRPLFPAIPDMWKLTYDLVAQIPEGRVSTYGAIAEALGDVRASKFVASALAEIALKTELPIERVIRHDGTIGGTVGALSPTEKRRRLVEQGVHIIKGRVRGFEGLRFVDFKSSMPLAALRKDQLDRRRRLTIPDCEIEIGKVAGVDISYDSHTAWAALVVVDAETGAVVETLVSQSKADFPYIPTYLAYRELPVAEPLISSLAAPTVLFYDGNGILHPEGFGVASHAGVLFGIPTVGVAKSRLCGTLSDSSMDNERAIQMDGRVVGYSVKRPSRSPIFVSPGHCIGLRQSLSIARRFMKNRIPEPLRMAHVLANNARRSASNK